MLQRLRHPNILSFHGVAVDDDKNLYLITELLSKNSLWSFLDENSSRISLEVKINILFQVAWALNYMHSQSPPIIHRDIKTLNIFITQEYSAKLGDFGLAKSLDD